MGRQLLMLILIAFFSVFFGSDIPTTSCCNSPFWIIPGDTCWAYTQCCGGWESITCGGNTYCTGPDHSGASSLPNPGTECSFVWPSREEL